MPIISVRSLPLENADTPSMLKKLCTGAAEAIGYEPSHIWATWEFLEPGNYAVGNRTETMQSATTHSPIVRVISFEGKPQKDIEKMMRSIAGIISSELNIDIGNIFIEYSEARSGMVFDGGETIYKKIKD